MNHFRSYIGVALIGAVVLWTTPSAAQKENYIWYFGSNAGIDFNTKPPSAIQNGKLLTSEGSTVVCDSTGKLLFYTDGQTIWNKNHDTLKNGTGLYGSITSTHSSLIIKRPGSTYQYFVFTTDEMGALPKNKGVNYTIVDISADHGNGAVIQKNVPVVPGRSSEKIAAIGHSNHLDFWIAVPLYKTDSLLVYRFTMRGLDTVPKVVRTGIVLDSTCQGQLKFSPDGRFIAYGNFINTLGVISFDRTSGSAATLKRIAVPSSVYGVEFSPNSRYLYFTVSKSRKLYQVRVDDSDTTFKSCYPYPNVSFTGMIQLGPDGLIYAAQPNRHYLGVIRFPSNRTKLAFPVDSGIYLAGGLSNLGLPSFLQYSNYRNGFVTFDGHCNGDSGTTTITYLDPPDSIVINWGDGNTRSYPASMVAICKHPYTLAGDYLLKITSYYAGYADTLMEEGTVSGAPTAEPLHDGQICDGEPLTLIVKANKGQFLWNNHSTDSFLRVTQPGNYTVRVYNDCGYIELQSAVTSVSCNCDIFLPNAFSPNGDNLNDVFIPKGSCVIKAYQLSIFNRWGELLFQTKDPTLGWDGKIDGHSVEPSVYVWTLDAISENYAGVHLHQSREGTVTVLK